MTRAAQVEAELREAHPGAEVYVVPVKGGLWVEVIRPGSSIHALVGNESVVLLPALGCSVWPSRAFPDASADTEPD